MNNIVRTAYFAPPVPVVVVVLDHVMVLVGAVALTYNFYEAISEIF